ncbi:MAG: WhiB family transcriptional regulator [Propionibacteriaceae bacterium]|nr:WhiB family transcriptional regulator [Propionibacteriaceae bacterium]
MSHHVQIPQIMAMVAAGGPKPGWAHYATCAPMTGPDRERFFPTRGEDPREAAKVCEMCPVRAQCLAEALVRDERWGVWGGMTTRQRDHLARGFYEAAS